MGREQSLGQQIACWEGEAFGTIGGGGEAKGCRHSAPLAKLAFEGDGQTPSYVGIG